jgi:phosphonate transport system substrate-binding protein
MINSVGQAARHLLVILGVVLFLYLWTIDAKAESLGAGDKEAPLTKRTLVIGKVTENPKKLYRYLKPMVDYAVKHMQDLGFTDGKVLMCKDNRQMISYLRQRKVDWITETPFSAAIFEKKAGAEIFLRKWKKGVPEYHTVFFTRKDSDIFTLSDLKGKTIAFGDSGSSTAFFIPAAVLIHEGLTLTQLATPREKPPGEMVGYAFSGQEINTATWVYRGVTAAGAFNNIDWEKDDHVRKFFREEMRIFHKTKSFPRAVEVVRKDLDPRVKQRLKSILLNAHNDPEAKKVLHFYQKTKKFDELDEKSLAERDEVRLLLKIVQSELQ